jgi:hypothetical protein
MDSATDTDSDADSSCAEPHSMRARWSPSFGSSPTDKQSSLQEINVALQNLRTVDMRLLVKVTPYYLEENLYKLYRTLHMPAPSEERLSLLYARFAS